ncbi:FAD-dependent monooxygenase [Sorangium sp. So ce1389]|uniref:FAD-dependent monooxygenase n=1 Tax=Sorangium sp. So ce1389 TaxID=3133336 RepID=UPI003F611EF1
MSKPRVRIAIIGGGIGGLTAAQVLLRAGHEVTCFEQVAELREVGAGIQVGPNASRVLHRLGLAEPLAKVAVQPVAIEIKRWDTGRVLSAMPGNPEISRRYGAPYYTMHRADLHAVLRAAVPDAALRLGARCVGVTHGAREVIARFADGSTHAADAVIGADGIRSQIRRTIADDAPRFSGHVACRVLVSAARVLPLASPPAVRIWLGPGQHMVCYPVSGGSLLNLATAMPSRSPGAESWTRAGRREDALARLAGWHEDLHTIMNAADETLELALHDRAALARPGEGRVTLLGDAAHPMLPFFAQGAAQAIEDAWMLGRCLEGVTPEGVAGALRRYERARARRAAQLQRLSARNGKLFQLPDGLRQRGRDLLLRRLSLESFAWLYGHDVTTAPIDPERGSDGGWRWRMGRSASSRPSQGGL